MITAVCVSILIQTAGLVFLHDQAIGFDSNEYLALSHSVYSGAEYSSPSELNGYDSFQGEAPTRMRQPLFPLLLVMTYWLSGGNILPTLLLQVFLLSASLVFIYKTAFMTLGERFKPWSILFPAFYFPWLLLSSKLLSEAFFTFLLWAAVFNMTKFVRSRVKRHLILAGILLGLLILTKSIGLAVLLLSLVSFAVLIGLKRGLLNWLGMSACAFAFLLPWGVRNYVQMGVPTFLPSNSGYNLWVASRAPDASWWSDSEEFVQATDDWNITTLTRQQTRISGRSPSATFILKDSLQLLSERGIVSSPDFPDSPVLVALQE